jgi:hypothetical protein
MDSGELGIKFSSWFRGVSFFHTVQTGYLIHQASVNEYRDCFTTDTMAGSEADLTSPRIEIKNKWSYTTNSACVSLWHFIYYPLEYNAGCIKWLTMFYRFQVLYLNVCFTKRIFMLSSESGVLFWLKKMNDL